MKKFSKTEAIAIVVQCAEKYKIELEGKNLLFICADKHKHTFPIEFSFYANNYMHLTGLKTNKYYDKRLSTGLHANAFYKKCLAHKLSPNDFDFSEDGTTHMKLNVLSDIICKNLHACIVGDYNSAKPRLYTEKIVGNIHVCMGFSLDKKTLKYVPNTVIQEDARNIISNPARVIAIYRKNACSDTYKELTYKAKKVEWSSIKFPDKFKYLSFKSAMNEVLGDA